MPAFRMEITAPLKTWNVFKSRARVSVPVPEIFRQCVFPETIQAVSAMCVGGPAMATAAAKATPDAATIEIEVARLPLLAGRPDATVVQIKATRSDIYGATPPEDWPHRTEEEFMANNAFWAQAKPKTKTKNDQHID